MATVVSLPPVFEGMPPAPGKLCKGEDSKWKTIAELVHGNQLPVGHNSQLE